ncbi:MAG: class I SAM-dependent methyltransferase [Gemmatimonadota bacterium]|nr:class I SAM-dependent methyltransferase [Gemmatimonadota bacterium]
MSFKITNDPETDYRAFVRAAYDRCAMDYANQRSPAAGVELNLIEERLAPGSRVLDVGCGAGIPVSRQLADKFKVTGVDISSSMIGMARKNVPSARFIRTDVLETGFPAAGFDAIVSYYAIFHIPRQEHRELFRRFARWLRPGGLLLFTVAPNDDGPGYTEDDFFGETMYWSNFGPGTYRKILTETGFEVKREGFAVAGLADVEGQTEVHPFFFAVRNELS